VSTPPRPPGELIVLWRFTGSRIDSAVAERRAQKIVAVSFLLFAPYIAAEALRRLINGDVGGGSWVGVILAAVGIVLMPIFGRAKQRLGAQLGSTATIADGTQNLLCACLSLTILLGLAAQALLDWHQLDPIVALVVAAGRCTSVSAPGAAALAKECAMGWRGRYRRTARISRPRRSHRGPD
jgi:hypothetical protein